MLNELLNGTSITLMLFAISWVVGLPGGLLLAYLSVSVKPIRRLVRTAAICLSVIPLLAILFWLHYPLQALLGIVVPPLITASCLLSGYVLFAVADIVGVELINTHSELGDIARVLGIPLPIFLKSIVMRGSFERSLPRLLTLAITSIHLTMFASLIGVEELFRAAQHVNSTVLKPVEVFTVMAIIYAALCLPLYALSRVVQKILVGHNTYA